MTKDIEEKKKKKIIVICLLASENLALKFEGHSGELTAFKIECCYAYTAVSSYVKY